MVATMRTVRRHVRLHDSFPVRGRVTVWGYGYTDVARLTGMMPASVKRATQARRGKPPVLDMADLGSVVDFIVRHRAPVAWLPATPPIVAHGYGHAYSAR
jgi:hypothetical protein